ncbi:MAG: rhombosortase [Planctomycetota bacterium]
MSRPFVADRPVAIGAGLTSIVVGVAVTSFFDASWSRGLEDRVDALSSGEWWRVFTGHCTHRSAMHLTLNLALFVPLGFVVSKRLKPAAFALALPLLAAGVAVGVRSLHGDWLSYRGLSGVVYGLATIAILTSREQTKRETRQLLDLTLALVVLKTFAECLQGGWVGMPETLSTSIGTRFLPGSHLGGLAAAFLLYGFFRLGGERWISTTTPSTMDEFVTPRRLDRPTVELRPIH